MTQDKTQAEKKAFSVDWLLRGTLTRLGDIFDRFTGRNWKPSSSIATSELIERLKKLLDSEVKSSEKKARFVPHNIKLKMQWDKFSTDSEEAMKKLEHELLTAVIDHINDNRYHTYAPIKLEIKPDYFIEGVKLQASFGKFADEETQEAELNVTVPNLKNIVIPPLVEIEPEVEKDVFIVEFNAGGKPKKVELAFSDKERLSVGRTKENALSIEDTSVSKIHAAFVLNSEKQLMVADTGSTNGTFINGKRIAYGKAFPVADGDKVKFGTVEVSVTYVQKEVPEEIIEEETPLPESALATERMISEEEYLKRQNETVASDKILENAPEEKSNEQSFVTTIIEPEKTAQAESSGEKTDFEKTSEIQTNIEETPAEDAPPVTEQRIVYDFGENK